ncbi:MAG: hypothetical protein IID31_13555, partial [Planctomycetes bacterium]|nr:hypothetical protein [Planctomycetota bacterium]
MNREDPDVIELWNLVFIQFNRESATVLKPLPARHVDTGLGLERLVSVLQGKASNYDTDLFTPLFEAIERETKAPHAYSGKLGEEDEGDVDMAYRVIADHVRTLTFAITDGAQPSNEGRGYVLRRILRRAVRFGHQRLGAETGFLSAIVPTLVSEMGDAFPELRKAETRVVEVIREEEESFGKTLDQGIRRLEEVLARTSELFYNRALGTPLEGRIDAYIDSFKRSRTHGPRPVVAVFRSSAIDWSEYDGPRPVVSADDAFQLYDTYGFPLDLTQMMAEERGLTVDVEGFERCMAEQKERSRAAQKATAGDAGEITLPPDAIARLKKLGVAATDDSQKFSGRDMSSRVRAIWNGADFDNRTQIGRVGGDRLTPTGIITERTSFYAEMGGQVADTGRINVTGEDTTALHDEHEGGEFKVLSARAFGGYVLHIGHMTRGEVRVGDRVALHVDRSRREPIRANHTATHLLNLGLRAALGEGTDQKGSLVAPDRLRFDFPHNGPVAVEDLAAVEATVNDQIERGLTVYSDEVPLELAKRVSTLRAVFGEIYPDPVRVVSVGVPIADLMSDPENEKWMAYSVELCGGTHLATTNEAKAFAIVSETGIAKGIRRIEAVTGVAAMAAETAADGLSTRIQEAGSLSDEQLGAECTAMAAQIDALTLSVVRRAALKEQLAGLQDRLKAARKKASKAAAKEAAARARVIGRTARDKAHAVVVERLDVGGDRAALQQAMKTIRDVSPGSAVLLASLD